MHTIYKKNVGYRGISLVGVIVAAALMILVFGGLFSAFVTLTDMIARQKGEAGAVALLNERMEYVRSLPYTTVGTVGGIVSGPLPQNSTTTLNGITYAERIFVNYIDDEADGTLLSDANLITADYKVVKIEYTWDHKGSPLKHFLVSNIVPNGMETLAGGGTLVIDVFDATVQPVVGAAVRVVNNTTTSTIDTTVVTNSVGRALFPGAPAAAGYEITVSTLGYSTDQTYSATTSNPNPNPPHVAVIESAVSSVSFSIDELSDLTLTTRGTPVTNAWSDTFVDNSLLETESNTTVSGGAIVLTDVAGVYNTPGSVTATATVPVTLDRWLAMESDIYAPTNTNAYIQLYSVDVSGTYTLIPDVDLPGNSTGFTAGVVDISGLSVGTYDRLAIGAVLSTTDTALTPEIRSWEISYEESAPSISGVTVDIVSNKTIGTSASSTPVYKYASSTVSNGSGQAVLSDMEWDLYTVTIDGASEGYDIAEACPNIPFALNPSVNDTVLLTLEPHVTNTLRIYVEDTNGNPIPGADVRLRRSGYDVTETTSVCGQVFYNSGLGVFSDYDVDVTASGYLPESVTSVSVDGNSNLVVVLST